MVANFMVYQEAMTDQPSALNWGKNCLNQNITNHFSKVCWKEKRNPDSKNTLIAQVQYDKKGHLYQL